MTLILTINGRESIWMLADRRLSYSKCPPKEDGRKIMFLETPDGNAILGYAGLGATARGIEPSDWMSSVLRGRNLSLEQSLGKLTKALQRQFPKHLLRFPKNIQAAHHIIIPSFVGAEVRLYSIDLVLTPDRKTQTFRYTRHIVGQSGKGIPRVPRLGLAGSGAIYLILDKWWIRDLLRLVRASDQKKISTRLVADYLAKVNLMAHQNTADGTVGPRCIVAWRHSKFGIHKGGGGHFFYDRLNRENDSSLLPDIVHGMDIKAITQVLMPKIHENMTAMMKGKSLGQIDLEKLNSELKKLPGHPDEDLK